MCIHSTFSCPTTVSGAQFHSGTQDRGVGVVWTASDGQQGLGDSHVRIRDR